jgi:hypothetical protein
MGDVNMELTKAELLKILEGYNDDTLICVKTWSSEVKTNVEVVEQGTRVILVGE